MAIEAVKLATIVVMYQWESLIQKTYLLFILILSDAPMTDHCTEGKNTKTKCSQPAKNPVKPPRMISVISSSLKAGRSRF